MASVFAHLTAIAGLLILPLIFFSALPEEQVVTFLMTAPPPPPPLRAPAPPAVRRVITHREVVARFAAPAQIPQSIPAPDVAPPSIDVPTIPEGIEDEIGVSGGIGTGPIDDLPGIVPAGPVAPMRPLPPLPPPPPAPKPLHRAPMRVTSLSQQNKLIRTVEPDYPELARRARVAGNVVLRVIVDELGNVSQATVVSGHPLLNDAAVQAVMKWKYTPTILDGEPVPVTTTVTLVFTLK